MKKICLPTRKRRVSFTARNKHKNRRLIRRSCPILVAGASDSDSSYFRPLRKSISSLHSETITDSYRLLMPKQKHALRKLVSIQENDLEVRHFRSVSKDTNQPSDVASTSNVSLPLSPELSVVENMSISREIIKNVTHPTINELQQNVYTQPMDCSEYVISNIDLSIPLMDQRCMLQKNTDGATSMQNINKSTSQIKDCTVDITMSDTLDRRLHALLLESAKKPNPTPMEIDQTLVTTKKTTTRNQKENKASDEENIPKNTKTKKRSSTPQKKKAVPKSKAPQNPIIEEEHIEACATGRKSCPPVLSLCMPMEEHTNNNDVTLPAKNNSKKKDIIKVKITKPKDRSKTRSRENLRGKSDRNSVTSNYSDNIHDAETISLTPKDSTVDLIHNHSETCLMARECIESDGSVEFIQNSPQSIFSVSSSRQSENSFSTISKEMVIVSEDTSNGRDNASERRASKEEFHSPKTSYHTPLSNNSLITEDLSNSPLSQPTKWYLLEEDITNLECPGESSYGSNLMQIFPIACAVPNLSTISEASREIEDIKKTGDLQQRLRKL